MIVFISAAATERQMVAATSKGLPVEFPTVQALDSRKLQSDDEIDNLLAKVGAAPCVFVVRVLGGKSYFAISIAFQIYCGCLVERWSCARELIPDCATKPAAGINFRGHGDVTQIDGAYFP